jgi:hypothetical protein
MKHAMSLHAVAGHLRVLRRICRDPQGASALQALQALDRPNMHQEAYTPASSMQHCCDIPLNASILLAPYYQHVAHLDASQAE